MWICHQHTSKTNNCGKFKFGIWNMHHMQMLLETFYKDLSITSEYRDTQIYSDTSWSMGRISFQCILIFFGYIKWDKMNKHFLYTLKRCFLQNMIWIPFIIFLQSHKEEFQNINGYNWKLFFVYFKFYAILFNDLSLKITLWCVTINKQEFPEYFELATLI